MSILKLTSSPPGSRALTVAAATALCLVPASLAAGSRGGTVGETAPAGHAGTAPGGAASAGPAAARTAQAPTGRAAKVIVVDDAAHMTLTNPSSASATLVEEGRATGSLPGTVRARLEVGANTVVAGFTIYLSGGTISGHSSAKLNPGRGEYASFSGALTVSHGSGHYAHASGSGELYGTINRNTDNATVQVRGNLYL